MNAKLQAPNPKSQKSSKRRNPKTQTLREDLERVINGHNAESGSDTPDFILAEYLTSCLNAFDRAVTAREKWYGRFAEAAPAPERPKGIW